jgi:hypothetical protein
MRSTGIYGLGSTAYSSMGASSSTNSSSTTNTTSTGKRLTPKATTATSSSASTTSQAQNKQQSTITINKSSSSQQHSTSNSPRTTTTQQQGNMPLPSKISLLPPLSAADQAKNKKTLVLDLGEFYINSQHKQQTTLYSHRVLDFRSIDNLISTLMQFLHQIHQMTD